MTTFERSVVKLVATSVMLAGIIMGVVGVSLLHDRNQDALTTKQVAAINQSLFKQDLPYCDGASPAQRLDASLVTDTEQPTPVLIYIHGGGWNQGDKNNTISQSYRNDFIARDIAFVSLNYRLSKEAVYPAENNDVACAVDYVIANAKQWNIDTHRIMIMGDSAGGQLASLEALDRKELYDGAIIAYGVSNVWQQITSYHDTNAVAYLGGATQATAQLASPQSADLRNAPPFILIHGTADSVVPVTESQDFARDLTAAGSRARFHAITGAQHAFLGTTTDYDAQARKLIFGFVESRW